MSSFILTSSWVRGDNLASGLVNGAPWHRVIASSFILTSSPVGGEGGRELDRVGIG